jgi:hypothetical protein
VPDKQQAVAASGRLDAKLTGANPIDVLIEFPKGARSTRRRRCRRSPTCTPRSRPQAGVGNVWSLETLRRWLAEKAGKSDVATLKQYVSVIPEHLVRRFISAEQDAVVVSGRVPDLDSRARSCRWSTSSTRRSTRCAPKHPGYEIAVTGLSAIAARNSANMIEQAQPRADVEFALVAIFIGLAFRSVVVMFSCILPGIFPVVLSGTVLWLLGRGAAIRQRGGADGVVRPRPERDDPLPQPAAAGEQARRHPELAVERATVLVGPALILTTVVLACGLS